MRFQIKSAMVTLTSAFNWTLTVPVSQRKRELTVCCRVMFLQALQWQTLPKIFTAEQVQSLRDEGQKLTHDDLDLVVMGQLRALIQNSDMTQKTRATNASQQHSSTYYRFAGHHVCVTTFCFVHTMSQKRFKSIKASWEVARIALRKPWISHTQVICFQFAHWLSAMIESSRYREAFENYIQETILWSKKTGNDTIMHSKGDRIILLLKGRSTH